jgi:hypothetical protein
MEDLKSAMNAPVLQDRLIENRKSKFENSSSRFDGQHLPAAVIPARGAGGVRRDAAAALGALAQLGGVEAVGRLARAQAHLRGFAFWDSHGVSWI